MNSAATLICAALMAAAATLALTCICPRLGWVAVPRADRWSVQPVARFGGVAIVLSFLLVTLALPHSASANRLALLTVAMAAIGLCDDLRALPPYLKLAGQFALAGAAVWWGFIYTLSATPVVNVVFNLLWMVGITNAFNLLDNIDGLTTGTGIITAVSILLVQAPSASGRGLILAMAGSLAGYLIFNFPPARIFMGDAGSLAIGFFLALAFVASAQHASSVLSVLFTPVLVLFLPIFDTMLVSVTRRLNGRAISAGAKDHSSHRLVLLGLSERGAVLTLYLISAISGGLALLLKRGDPDVAPGVLTLFLVAATLFWLYLAKIELPADWLSRTNVFTLVLPEFLNSLAKRTAAFLLDMVLLLVAVYLAFLLRFDGGLGRLLNPLLLTGVLSLVVKAPLLALFSVYRGSWELESLREAYPIVKASACGMLIMISILFYLTRNQSISRSVLVLDLTFTLLLLTAARLTPRLFHDMLPKRSRPGCLLAGGASAQFFIHYFEWKQPQTPIRAVVDDGGIGKKSLKGLPVISLIQAASLMQTSDIAAVYILPDCRVRDRDSIFQLCASHHLPVHFFRFSLNRLATLRPLSPANQDAAETGMVATVAHGGD